MQFNTQEIVDIVIASGCLGTSERQSNLLKYLLEKRELGQSRSIKSYNIAIDIMDRPESFDASVDSIVRVEMHRLRRNLKTFNGQNKDFSLLLPASSFVITIEETPQNALLKLFTNHYKKFLLITPTLAALIFGVLYLKASPPVQLSNTCSKIIPNISVQHSGDPSDIQGFVGNAIRSTLVQYTNLQLVNDIETCHDSGTPNFTIDYMALQKEDDTYRIALTTYNKHITNIVSFKNLGGAIKTPEDEDTLFNELNLHLATISKPYGLVPKYATTVEWNDEVVQQNYQCLITMYDSFITDSHASYLDGHRCLEHSVATGIAPLDNIGGLAASFTEQHYGRDKTVENPLEVAGKLIESVGPQWIDSTEMVLAKIYYESERPDYNDQRLLGVLYTAQVKYPSHPIIQLSIGIRVGFKIGDWERASSTTDHALKFLNETDNSSHKVYAAYALLFANPDELMDTCRLTYSEHSINSNLIVNACARKVADSEWISKTDANLRARNLLNAQDKIEYIKKRKFEPKLTAEMIKAYQRPQN